MVLFMQIFDVGTNGFEKVKEIHGFSGKGDESFGF